MSICFCVLSWGDSDNLSEAVDKMACTTESNLLSALLNRNALAKKNTGLTDSVIGDIGTYTEPGQGLKLATEVVFTNIELFTQIL